MAATSADVKAQSDTHWQCIRGTALDPKTGGILNPLIEITSPNVLKKITSTDVRKLIELLKLNPAVPKLTIYDEIDETTAKHLGEELSKANTGLVSIHLKLGEDTHLNSTIAFLMALQPNPALTINLSYNDFTQCPKEKMEVLVQALAKFSSLDLILVKSSPTFIRFFFKTLEQNTSLKRLQAYGLIRSPDEETLQAIIGTLKNNRTITELMLCEMKLNAESWLPVLKALEKNTGQMRVKIGEKFLSRATMVAVIKTLEHDTAKFDVDQDELPIELCEIYVKKCRENGDSFLSQVASKEDIEIATKMFEQNPTLKMADMDLTRFSPAFQQFLKKKSEEDEARAKELNQTPATAMTFQYPAVATKSVGDSATTVSAATSVNQNNNAAVDPSTAGDAAQDKGRKVCRCNILRLFQW